MSGDFVSDGQPFETPIGAATEGYASTPPSFARGFGALFSESSLVERAQRAAERGQFAGSSWFDRYMAVTGMANAGLVVPAPVETPVLSPKDANDRYAPEGTKITDVAIPEGIAQLVGKAKQDEIERQSVLSRFTAAHSWPVNLGTGLAAFMLDPLNAATAFLPGVGEEAFLGRLGTGFLARTTARVAAGGVSGAIAQAPASFARYALGQEEASDYGLRDAFRDMMFSAAGGALLHAGFGAVGDVFRPGERMPAPRGEAAPAEQPFARDAAEVVQADAATKADAMRASVSQILDGREVNVQPVLDAKPPRRPFDIIDFLMSKGGVRDEGGELAVMDLNRPVPGKWGVLSRSFGLRMDYAREAAEEEGYLRPGSNINDLLDALRETANGNPRFVEVDPEVQAWREWQEAQARGPEETARRESDVWGNGFSEGISQQEFEALNREIYGPSEHETAAAEAEAAKDAEMTARERWYASVEERLSPEERAELQRSRDDLAASVLQDDAFGQAGQCLSGAFL